MKIGRLVCAFVGMFIIGGVLQAQSKVGGEAVPVISKIDPPSWFANLPKPMLLIQGEHLDSAQFTLSDKSLGITRTYISANGHWCELWLDKSPASPETIDLVAHRGTKSAIASYTFTARKAAAAGFSSKDVMYLIMTDRFANGDPSNDHQSWDNPDEKSRARGWHGGDLKGITQHLDYLQQLGITTVWITPVDANRGDQSYHGYGATDMYAVDEHYGTLQDLEDLSTALHGRGMKLVLDLVPNHIGASHPWVADSPEPDWFHGTKAHHDIAQGEFAPLTNPHAPWRDQKDVTEGWFANVLPDMNQENPAVSQYLIQNAEWWIEEAGVDGLRLDTFPYVGRQFWQDFHATLHQLYPHLTTVGEIFNGDATIVSSFAGGVTRTGVDTGLDTPFDFPSYFALREVFLRDAPVSRLAEVLREDSLYPHPERLVPFLGNHDTKRFLSEPVATTERLKMAFAVLTTMRGMPEIYSGDEIAMRGGEDPDNRRNFPGGFTSDPHSAFTSSGRVNEENEMHDWVAELLRIRKAHAALESGEEQVLTAKAGVMAYVRGSRLASGCASNQFTASGEERILITVNNGDQPEIILLPAADTSLSGCGTAAVVLGAGSSATVKEGVVTITAPPRQVSIFSLTR